VKGLRHDPGEENRIEVAVQGSTGTLALNGRETATFDLSSFALAGDVWIASGTEPGTAQPGRIIEFRDFGVWALPLPENA
jgi:hypothetical protein